MLSERDRATRLASTSRIGLRWGYALLRPLARFARRRPLGAIGGVILLVMIFSAVLAPLIAPFPPKDVHVTYKYASPGTTHEETGQKFWLGADQLGGDTLSRIIYGARISLQVSLLSVAIGVTLGAMVGIISAYFGSITDLISQRIIDALMAFPTIILALSIRAAFGSSLKWVIVAIVVILVPGAARLVRSQALAVKEMDYTLAARALGAGPWRIIFRHMLPNCMAPYIVFATANLGVAIVVEASLSFLGLGIPSNIPSWGGMLHFAGQQYVEVAPWLLLFPSVAISIAVFGFNLLGDAIRDDLDPRLRGTGV